MPVVEIRGNSDLRRALKLFAPDLEKALVKELGEALQPVAKQAKSFVPSSSPLSGWSSFEGRGINAQSSMFRRGRFPLYSASLIRSGIKVITKVGKRSKDGYTSMARIENQSAVGAIYETAGRKHPNGQKWVGSKAGGTSKNVSRSNNPNAGQQFISHLPPLTNSLMGRGRLIYRAWAENKGVAMGGAMKAIDKARTEFYARAQTQAFEKVVPLGKKAA